MVKKFGKARIQNGWPRNYYAILRGWYSTFADRNLWDRSWLNDNTTTIKTGNISKELQKH